ncbi:MAG: alanine--glyoxylate aminotransferase family protein, partial [bacterium]|nr:alanine--glyoxylate aminotransferase family protein [bacterium]
EQSKSPRYYFDLRAYKKALDASDSPYTPAISLLYQLKEALKIIQNETMEGMWARHAWLAKATRAAVKALNLELFAERPGNILTSIKIPAGVDGEKLVKTMRDDLGVTIAGGQGSMKGKVMRIAHLGYMDRFDITTAISALEIALKRQGFPVKLGARVSAAEEILWEDPK